MQEPGLGGLLGPIELIKHCRNRLPGEPFAASNRLAWVGLQAERSRAPSASECSSLAIPHHRLVLFARPPEELHLLYEGVKGDSFWTLLGVLLRREYFCSSADLVVSIMGRAMLLLAVPAVTLGWVLQAFVVMLWSMAQSTPLAISTDPRESFFLPEVRK